MPADAARRRPAGLPRRHRRAARGRRRARRLAAARGRRGRRGRTRARVREWRTFALIELAWARSARARGAAGIAAHRPRAILYSSTTAALLAPAPGAIRFDAPAAGNRPGRHGIWQRPVERRRLAAAPLLRAVERGRARRGAAAARRRGRRAGAGRAERAAAARARHRRDHLRREPGEEGPRPRARRVGARRGGRARSWSWPGAATRRRRRRACASPGCCRAPSTARCCGARACSSCAPRREDYGIAQLEALADGCVLVTTPSPGPVRRAAGRARARPAARRRRPRRRDPRARSTTPRPGYAERALEALAPWRPEAVDRVVAEQLLPRLQSLA